MVFDATRRVYSFNRATAVLHVTLTKVDDQGHFQPESVGLDIVDPAVTGVFARAADACDAALASWVQQQQVATTV